MKILMTLKTPTKQSTQLNGKVFYLMGDKYRRIKFIDVQTNNILKNAYITKKERNGDITTITTLSGEIYELINVGSIIPTAGMVGKNDIVFNIINTIVNKI